MPHRKFRLERWTLACLLSLVLAAPAAAREGRSYIMGTATTGGTYYPVGVAIATLVKVKLEPAHKIAMSAISTAGTAENIKLLRENQVQFALLQGIYGAWAYAGEGPLKADGPQTHLRSIASLWKNVEHFVVRGKFVRRGTLDDLKAMKGEKFSIGARYSGTEGSARTMLEGLGVGVGRDLVPAYLTINATVEALQNGTIAGANLGAGIPIGGITQLLAAGVDIRILDVTDDELKRVNSRYSLWTRYTIPAGTYPKQARPIATVAQPNLLAARADVDEADVYLITRTMFENLPFLRNIHAAMNEVTLETATAGLPFPLHPGALRYYEEVGLKVPDRLRP